MLPPVVPASRAGSSVVTRSNFIRPSGVAAVTVSARSGDMSGMARLVCSNPDHGCPCVGHVVRATGNAAWRNARPSSAGLNTFCPSPPYTSFPKTMANAPPVNAIQSGRPGGSVSASRRPVIIADPSPSDPPRPNRRSGMRAPATQAATISSTLGPKNHVAAITTGARLATTDHMMRGVLSAPPRWGDALTTRRDSVIAPPSSGPPCRRRTSG